MKNMKKIDLSGFCHGITTLGERGQVVIPQQVRRKLKLKQQDKLFVFSKLGKVIILIKTSDWNSLIKMFLPQKVHPQSKHQKRNN